MHHASWIMNWSFQAFHRVGKPLLVRFKRSGVDALGGQRLLQAGDTRRVCRMRLVEDLGLVPFRDADPVEIADKRRGRSEEHTSELQSPTNLVCRLLLEKK